MSQLWCTNCNKCGNHVAECCPFPKRAPETGDTTLETIQTAYAADSLLGNAAICSNARPRAPEVLTYEKLKQFYLDVMAALPVKPRVPRWFDRQRFALPESWKPRELHTARISITANHPFSAVFAENTAPNLRKTAAEKIEEINSDKKRAGQTEIAGCGCVVMKGWRCPVHSAP
jgi:hypothetical protein